jgi:hypothetical protein
MKNKMMIFGITAAFSVGFATQALAEKQPMMHRALTQLEEARRELENATPYRSGHRERAIEHINAAINEVRLGIEFDDTH